MRLWLKKSAARPAGSRSARRRDPTRRRALPPRRRALLPPPSGPRSRALSPRRLRLELLADGRLQRARFRRLRTPTRGIAGGTGVSGADLRLLCLRVPEHLSVLQRACLLLRDPR